MVVLAYHSLEDRMVKERFADWSRTEEPGYVPTGLPRATRNPLTRLLTRRAQRPSDAELEANPRSSSARLRASGDDGGRHQSSRDSPPAGPAACDRTSRRGVRLAGRPARAGPRHTQARTTGCGAQARCRKPSRRRRRRRGLGRGRVRLRAILIGLRRHGGARGGRDVPRRARAAPAAARPPQRRRSPPTSVGTSTTGSRSRRWSSPQRIISRAERLGLVVPAQAAETSTYGPRRPLPRG